MIKKDTEKWVIMLKNTVVDWDIDRKNLDSYF